jgi:hypothetical protein
VPADLADLCFEFHYGCDLADADVLAQLQVTLGRLAPRMSATLDVHAYERDRARRHIDVADPDALRTAVLAKGTERGPTYQALIRSHGAPRQDRRFGHVFLRGRGAGSSQIFLSVGFDSLIPAKPSGRNWLWSNSIGGRISATRVEGTDRQEWVCRLAEELTTTTTMLWGAAYLHPEFARSNLDTTKGMRAIGRDVRTALPGIYWLNIFGPPYVDLIGEHRLLDAPADTAKRSGNHVTIRTYRDAQDWQVNDEARHRLAAALGAEHFFDRNDPTRRHRAPAFGLPELPDKPPFQVLTTDGVNVTPLP